MTETVVEGTRVGIGVSTQVKAFLADVLIPELRNVPYYPVNLSSLIYRNGVWGSVVVKALRY